MNARRTFPCVVGIMEEGTLVMSAKTFTCDTTYCIGISDVENLPANVNVINAYNARYGYRARMHSTSGMLYEMLKPYKRGPLAGCGHVLSFTLTACAPNDSIDNLRNMLRDAGLEWQRLTDFQNDWGLWRRLRKRTATSIPIRVEY